MLWCAMGFELERRNTASPTQAMLTASGRAALALPAIGSLWSNPGDVLLFDAAYGWPQGDMVARFWREEFLHLDWLRDFIRDDKVVVMFDKMDDSIEIEEEDHDMWSKADLQNLATEMDYD